jgi:hypothetical protein
MLLIAFGLMVTSVSLAAAGAAWWSAATARALAEQGDAANRALADRLDRVIAAAEDHKSSDWANFQVRLVQERPDGPPAEGFTVELYDTLVAEGGNLKRVSGPTGIVDLGPVRLGRQLFSVTAPWQDRCRVELDLRPLGTHLVETIVCPAAPPPEGEVTVTVDWPVDLQVASIGLICLTDSKHHLECRGWQIGGEGLSGWFVVMGDGAHLRFEKCRQLTYNDAGRALVRGVEPAEATICRGAIHNCTVREVWIEDRKAVSIWAPDVSWTKTSGTPTQRRTASSLCPTATAPSRRKCCI